MSVTLQNIYDELDDYRIDTSSDTLDRDTEILRAINRTLRIMQSKHSWVDKTETITFNKGIDEYAVNTNYKYNCSISLKNADTDKSLDRININDFYKCKNDGLGGLTRFYAPKLVNGNKRILIYCGDGDQYLIDDATDISVDGTWTLDNDAINLIKDTVVYKDELGSSLKFDINGTIATIKNLTFTAVDLSDIESNSNGYIWVYLPTVTNLTNVEIQFGSDSSNYWTKILHFSKIKKKRLNLMHRIFTSI